MTIRNLHNTLKTSLMNYDPFIVAHLIKFERPQKVSQFGGDIQGTATDYTYITDSQHDILYDDGETDRSGSSLGVQTYRANKILSLGVINENIQAKASNMSIKLDTAALGASAISNVSFTSTEITGDVDLQDAGFQEGDKIKLSRAGSSNDNKHVRIEKFKNGGKTIVYTAIDTITNNGSALIFTISLAAEEINALLLDKESSSYTNYINREVLIYKVHINPETRAIIGEPFLYFKGITSGASIQEKLESSDITWTLSSHWGDFIRVQGRLTDDATHRALQIDGSPDLNSVLRSDYATDLGFIHSNTAINALSNYMAKEKDYKQVDINGGWPGGKRLREIEIEVPRQTDLQFNLQAKMLPVVYGVRKIDSFPVFVDTHKDTSAEVYKVDAICEGKIAGILDVYIEGNPQICLDKADFDMRNSEGSSFDSETVEVQCAGRADRGDTLAEYSAEPTETELAASHNDDSNRFFWSFGKRTQKQVPTSRSFFHRILFRGNRLLGDGTPEPIEPTGAANPEVADATGILHRGTNTITSPIKADLTFHQGLPDQNADNTLVNLAANNKFKIQNDYYPATAINPYWSPSHRLLDTAYVMGKYTISDGETTIPKFEYVVRGRDPECYNYDGSYRQETKFTSAAYTAFALGSSVTLHETGNNAQIGSAVDIMDKWVTFDSDGNRDYRFRFSTTPTLVDSNEDAITAFYMKSGSDKWYMQTWDHSEIKAAPGGKVSNTTFSSAAGTANGRKYTFTSIATDFEAALSHPTAEVGITSSGLDSMLASTFSDFDYNATTNVLDNLTHLSDDPATNEVVVKNAIKLSSGASSTDNFYNGATITVTSTTSDGTPYVQERKVVDYMGSTKIAIVDSPWDWQNIPDASDTYEIGSIGDRRVTLNPAMQLLDYLTNKRYGKGLNITRDIDLDQFKSAAVKCDTRADVSMVFSSSTSFSVGEKYQYPQSGTLQWRGTIKKIESAAGKQIVTFTDVIGKLGTKWNNYKTFASGELYWYDGKVYAGTGSTVTTAPGGSGNLTSVTLYKVGGGTAGVDISSSAANGNPLVKRYSGVSGGFTASGYSLYDCDDIKYWKYLGWDDGTQRNVTRHQMNQVIDTKLALFENINKMLYQFNGMLKYTAGKYGLEVKGQKGTVQTAEQISNEDIIGTIKISDKGLKNSKNYVSTSIIDPANKFEGRSVSFFNSTYLKEDKGVQKKGQLSQQGVTNYFNARFNIQQFLDESRYGLTIQFTMAPRGLLLTAGTIIELTYPRFGYTAKEFRITNLNFKKDGTIDITADEHNDSAYVVPESGAGVGFGIVEAPEVAQTPQSLPVPVGPSSLQCTQTKQGEIALSWNNADSFSSATHTVEIYSSTVNNFTNNTDPVSLIGTSVTNVFHDLVTEGQGNTTRYYWIRYQVRTPQLNLAGSDFRNVPSKYLPVAPTSGTHVGVAGIGQASFAPRSVDLDPGADTAFIYNNAGTGIQSGEDTSSDMTTTVYNAVGTVTYQWKLNGTNINGATSANFTYNAPSNFSDMPQIVSVHVTDTLSDGTTLTAENQFTYIGLRTVEDGYTVVPSTPNYNFQSSEFGTIDGASSFTTTFSVRKGGTTLSYDGTSSYDANSFRYGTVTNITPSGSVVPEIAANGTVDISTSSGSFLTGTSVTQCSFDVPIIDNSTGETVATSRIVLSKSLDGINARTVKLSAPEQVITYDSTGATPDPSATFEITAEPFNTTGTPKYEFFLNGTSAQSSSTDATFTYTPPAAYTTLPQVVTVKLRENNSQDVLATDTFTVFGVKDATDAVDQKTVFIFAKNDSDAVVGFQATKSAADQNFANPLAELESGWSTSQPALGANNDVIYMSQRTFTSDGSSPQQNSWSTPVVAARRIDGTSFTVIGSVTSAATANVRFRFEKNAYPDTSPSYDTGNILISGQTNTSYSVTIPSSDNNISGNDFGSFLMYVSPRDVPVNIANITLNASSDTSSTNEPNFSEGFGGATISDATVGAIFEHPTGSGTESWGGFANTETTLLRSNSTPISFSSDGSMTFDAFVPNANSNAQSTLNAAFGSPSAGDAVIAQDSGNLWIYNGTQWNDVGQIKGDDGTDGINEKRVYLFVKNPTLTGGNPPAVTADAGQQTYLTPTSGVINGWTTTQGSLTADDDIVYMVQRLFTDSGTGTESSWSAPIVIAQKIDGSPGTNGINQKVVSVFKKNDNSIGFSSGDATGQNFANPTNNLEADWSTTQPALSANGDIVYMSQRLFTSDGNSPQATAWSAPVIVARRTDGTAGNPGQVQKVIRVFKKGDSSLGFASGDATGQNFANPTNNLEADWSTTQPAISTDGDIVYMSQRLFTSDAASPQESIWSAPVVVARREDGANGADAIVLAYDNSSHVVPVSTSGTAVFSGSGGTLRVYEGNTELSLKTDGQQGSAPSSSDTSTFNVDIAKVTGNTLTEPGVTGAGSTGAVIADFAGSGLTQVTKYLITARIRTSSGASVTRSVEASIVPADQGATGSDGLRTVTGYLYYEKTTANAPAAPSGNTFLYENGLVSGTGINDAGTTNCWKNTPNTMQSTGTNTYYIMSYFGIESAPNQSSATVSYGTVRQHTSFSGVVTFSSGTFSSNNSAISGIDGTKLVFGSTALTANNTLNTNTTKADVGLANVDDKSSATIQSDTLTAATSTDVGLGNVDNDSTADIRSGTTKANVGLNLVDNLAASTIRSGTTKANVGLGNVDDKSSATIQSDTLTAATSADVGLGNVDNDSTADIRSGTTKANVGLGNVDDKSSATIQSDTLTAATSADVGLGNVDNDSTADIRSGTTKANVGLDNVDNLAASAIRAGTTKSNVGLGNVDDKSSATIQSDTLTAATSADVGLGNVDNDSTADIRSGTTKANVGLGNVDDDSSDTIRAGISINADGTLTGAGSGQVSATGLGAETLSLSSSGVKPVGIFGNEIVIGDPGGTYSNSFDTQVFSKDSYEAAQVSWEVAYVNTYAMVGLNTDPESSASYTSLDFAWYMRNNKLFAYKNGASQSGALDTAGEGAYAVGDKLSISYDGVNVRFYANGTLKKTIAHESSSRFYLDSSFNKKNTGIKKLQFGSITSNAVSAAPTGVKNDQVTIAKDSSGNISLTNANTATISLDNSDVGLGNVDNDSTADIRSGTTKANVGLDNVDNLAASAIRAGTTKSNVGLGNVDDKSSATIQSDTLTAATSADVGLGNVDNDSTADIRSGTTKANVGLNLVDNLAASAIRAGTTKSNVGLGNVDDKSSATIQSDTLTAATSADVGLGNVDNDSTADIRSGTTKANVGLGNVDDKSSATIQSDTLTAATSADVGLGNVDNDSTADIRSGTTKANVGLDNVDNLAASAIRAGTTKSNVGLGNVDDKSSATIQSDTLTAATSADVGLGNVDNDSTADIRSGTTKANVGLGNVDNNSTADIRAGTTKANVGLGNVDDKSSATIQSDTLTAATSADVGLGNVDNDSTADIRSGTTKANVGLGNVDNNSTADIRSGTTKANVGLGNVDNDSTADILAGTHTGSVSGDVTGNVTGKVNNVAVNTVTSGAAEGAQVQAQQSLLPRADDSEWTLGAVGSGAARGIWQRNGAGGDENTIVLEEGPFGDLTRVWKSISTDDSGADGGFHNNSGSHRFPIQNDVVYRFTAFVKQSDADGSIYFGAYNYNSTSNINMFNPDGNGGTTNKYWRHGDLPTLNEWYLWVGYLNPHDVSSDSGKTGYYKVSTGELVAADNDIRFNSNADTFAVRTYLYYSSTNSGTIARWAHPRVDRMDRAAPSIMQLLSDSSSVLNKQITLTSNAGTVTLNNAGSGSFSKTDIALGNVDNDSTSDIRSGTTKANVGLNLVDNLAASTIRSGTTKANVGLANVDNDSTDDIRSGTTKANVGLGNVDNNSTADIRSGTTKANVGLGNVDDKSSATIQSDTLTAATSADVGLGNVDNNSTADIRSGTTKANVGLGNVDNNSTADIRSGTTKANVGLGNVDNDSSDTIRGGISINADGTLTGAGSGQVSASGLGAESVRLLSHGTKPVTITGNTVSIGAGGNSWNTGVYSFDGYDEISASWVVDQTGMIAMIGVNADPASSTNYYHLDFAIYFASANTLQIRKNGDDQSVSGLPTYAAGDKFTLTYDGTKAEFFKNGTSFHSITASASGPFHLDSSWHVANKSISQVQIRDLNDFVAAPATLKNDQVTIAKDSSGNISLTNANSATISLDNSDVGLGNVDNDSTADIRSGTTKANVGLGNVDNNSTADIRSGTTKANVGLNLVDNLAASTIRSGTTKANVGLDNVNNPGSATTPIGAADVANNIGGLGLTTIDGGLIKADSTITAGTGNSNVAGLTGRNANNSGPGSADTDIRIFAGSDFDNRGSAPFRVTQGGGFRAEFGHIGGFTIGSDALISTTADQPQITLGKDLINTPNKQITLSARTADDFVMYAGVAVPAGGIGIKTSDNPPFAVTSEGKVFMRSFELRDSNNSTILSSDNLLSNKLLSQINSQLKAGSSSVEFVAPNPNDVIDLVLSASQTINIGFELPAGHPYVSGMRTASYSSSQALNSIVPSYTVKVEYRSEGTSTWYTFGTQSFTSIQQGVGPGGAPSGLNANKYWVSVETYQDRDRGPSYVSKIESGYGCITSEGNLKGSVSRTLAAGDWEFRINSTNGSGVTIGGRSFTPTAPGYAADGVNSAVADSGDVLVDNGYGSFEYFANSSPSDSIMRTSPRNFLISGTASSYSVDTNLTPIEVKEGKTFDDFLPLSGGTVTGNLEVDGEIRLNNTNTRLDQGANNSLLITTNHGSLNIGPQNSFYAHFNTNRPAHYFNKTVRVDGKIDPDDGVLFADNTTQTTAFLPHLHITAYWNRSIYAHGDGSGSDPNTPSAFYTDLAANSSKDFGQDSFYSRGSIEQRGSDHQVMDSNVVLFTMWVYNMTGSDITRTARIYRVDDEARLFVNSHSTASETRTSVFDAHSLVTSPLDWDIVLESGYNKVQFLVYDHGSNHNFEMTCPLIGNGIRFVPEEEKSPTANP